ncbi:hypothetical protein ACOIPX_001065 [Salmonella enterica]
MKKIITCALVAAAAAVALPASATILEVDGTVGTQGAVTTSTSFDYNSRIPSADVVYTTATVVGQESTQHGVLANTTFTVPSGVTSLKLTPTFTGDNSGSLEATLATDANSVAVVKNTASGITGTPTLHILLQNSKNGQLSAGTTHVTYSVTSYTS